MSCSSGEPEEQTEALSETEQAPEKPQPGDDATVLIPGGEFMMGSDIELKNFPKWYAPAHSVKLDPYWIDVYEVTFYQFLKFTVESDYTPEGDWRTYYATGKEDYPVVNVTFDDAKTYCEWAGKRLPSEAEWEHAARGADNSDYPWGNDWNALNTNTNEAGIRDTQAVGSRDEDRSSFGLYDTQGNVQEWVTDKFKPYRGSPARNDPAFNQPYRVVKGSSYATKGEAVRLWSRMGFYDKSQSGTGFRCAKDANQPESEESASN